VAALTLGIDLGTTGTKAVVADPGAGVISESSRPAELWSDHPGWADARACAEITELNQALDGVDLVTRTDSAWKQILADDLSAPLLPVTGHPGASLGAALAAAVGAGLLPGWAAGGGLARTGEPVEPDPATLGRYLDAYELGRQLGAATTPLAHRLAERDRTTPALQPDQRSSR
jgi:sugar (pentulose or hexulose) kinase